MDVGRYCTEHLSTTGCVSVVAVCNPPCNHDTTCVELHQGDCLVPPCAGTCETVIGVPPFNLHSSPPFQRGTATPPMDIISQPPVQQVTPRPPVDVISFPPILPVTMGPPSDFISLPPVTATMPPIIHSRAPVNPATLGPPSSISPSPSVQLVTTGAPLGNATPAPALPMSTAATDITHTRGTEAVTSEPCCKALTATCLAWFVLVNNVPNALCAIFLNASLTKHGSTDILGKSYKAILKEAKRWECQRRKRECSVIKDGVITVSIMQHY